MEIYGQRSMVHYYINELAYERNGWFFFTHQPCDRIFIHPNLLANDRFETIKFENLPRDYYDYVIVGHVDNRCFSQMLDYFKTSTFVSVHDIMTNQDNRVKSFYSHFGIDTQPPSIFKKYTSDDQYFMLKSIIGNKGFIMIFPFSTRVLSTIQQEGIRKIVQFAKNRKLMTLICGENFDPYSVGSGFNNIIRNFLLEFNDNQVINIMGMGTHKLFRLLDEANYVFYAPTGAAMLKINGMEMNPNSYIISGGDSNIMMDISNEAARSVPELVVKDIKTKCPYFPCGGQQDDLPMSCRKNENALCLNNQLVIPDEI
jgi:hypothetical protein